jgi:hypothetical protein
MYSVISFYFQVICKKNTEPLFQNPAKHLCIEYLEQFCILYNLGMQCISIIVGGVSTGESGGGGGGLTHPIILMEIYYMCYTSTTTNFPPCIVA